MCYLFIDFFNLNTGDSTLPCTGFFHDVCDNILLNETTVKVTGTKFFSKARYKSFNDLGSKTFLTKIHE